MIQEFSGDPILVYDEVAHARKKPLSPVGQGVLAILKDRVDDHSRESLE